MADDVTIAVVDNDPGMCEVIIKALNKIGGFTVYGFDDVPTALAFIERQRPAAVFVNCPNVDGQTAAFLKALRGLPGCSHTPVILASDRRGLHQIRRYKAIGATTVIPTPVNPFGLSEVMKSVMAETAPLRPQSQPLPRPVREGLLKASPSA